MMDYRRAWRPATFLVVALAALGLHAPVRAADDVRETRPVSGFDKIDVSGAFRCDITAGAGTTHVVVAGSPDVVRRVTTQVRDGTLFVGMRKAISFLKHSPSLTIAVPALHGFSNEGAGTARIVGLTGGDFALANSGTADISAAGRAASEVISLDGIGKIDTTALDAGDVTVNNNGVGSVHVRAHGLLTMTVNGVGEIRYAGNPTGVESTVNGVGKIGRL